MRQVVNHNGAVQVCERRICTVLLPYESSPTLGVHGISVSSGVPEIDSADRVPVLRQDIVLTDKAGYGLIFRRCAQEDPSCLVPRDGLWQLVRGDDCDRSDPPSGDGDCEKRLTIQANQRDDGRAVAARSVRVEREVRPHVW